MFDVERTLMISRSIVRHRPRDAALFDQGASFLRRGMLGQARDIFERVLDREPRHYGALHMLGVIAAQAGNLEQAATLMARALEINPFLAAACCDKGNVLQALGRQEEAVASYDRALAIQPADAVAFYNRGIALEALGRMADAVTSYERAIAIKPDYAEAFYNCGNALQGLNRLEDAVASYDRALAIKPDFAAACYNRGNALLGLKRLEEAAASFERTIQLRPDHVEAYSNRGYALLKLERSGEALTSFDRAIALRPAYAEAHSNRGSTLQKLNRLQEALASFDRAIAIKPDYAEAHSNRGNVLQELNRPEEAVASHERAIALWPDYAEAHSNRGNALLDLRRVDDALACYDRAIAIRSDYVSAYWNKSLALLLCGRLEQGWEWYEWRWQNEDLSSYRNRRAFLQPIWLGGEPLAGKTLLLHAEQGLGDAIQFCRYAPMLNGLGARVLLEVPAALMELLKTLAGIDELLERGKPLPSFDCHCPLLSLPLAFRTTLETIPESGAYLATQGQTREKWGARLGEKRGLRVGLVWSGSRDHTNDRNRSVPLAQLASGLPEGVDYVSLQKEVREGDEAALSRYAIRHFGEQLEDFSDTAALCDLMDLVISVDTSVAHLAGALRRPVWVILPATPDWRWMLDREDSPWYPSMRLFRQQRLGQWGETVLRVGRALSDVMTGRQQNANGQ